MFPERKERSRNNPIVRVYFRILVLLVCLSVYGSEYDPQRKKNNEKEKDYESGSAVKRVRAFVFTIYVSDSPKVAPTGED